MIDTHLHILDPARFPYPLASKGYVPAPHESATAADVLAVLAAHGVERAIAVQPTVYGTDNTALLAEVDRRPTRFRAVVMAEPGDVARLCRRPGVAGLRLNLADFRGQAAESAAAAGRIALREGKVVILQARPDALPALVDALGDGPVVLDHLGRVDLTVPGGADEVKALAARPETYLKVSAPFRVAGAIAGGAPSPSLTDLVAAFPPARRLWGSDYPFINAGTRPTYAEVVAFGRAVLDMDVATRTAARLFGFDD
ncbi:amidohydrolase family protein [Acuticoccus mangrovi]|uniref:Amidohydrolase family protein n=1 Tax=Acuticoccus mangrovi TaxID=2796142 RepID=A0A934IKW0_9HYPH|nr:amidohydrolase family protein [Acuticoccus mangrovi]